MIQSGVAALEEGSGHSLRTAPWLEPSGALRIRHYHVVGVLTLLLAVPAWADTTPEPVALGGFPVCEASSAVLVLCSDGSDASCLLVGDNEERQRIFLYPFDSEKLDTAARSELDITPVLSNEKDLELSDIEALTRLRSGEVMIFGSHSRNKKCEPKGKRRQYVGVRIEGGEIKAGEVELVDSGKKLAETIPEDASEDLEKVRAAIEEADKAADAMVGDGCDVPQTFNIEGVVAVSGDSGDEVWIGLRAPTVEGQAVLLRQKAGLETLEFDSVRFVDLGGWGVRDLAVAGDWIWGIAGPVPDNAAELFKLWRFPVAELAADEIHIEEGGRVPNSSEGLAIAGNTAIVLIDGDEAQDDPTQCARDASYITLAVPD